MRSSLSQIYESWEMMEPSLRQEHMEGILLWEILVIKTIFCGLGHRKTVATKLVEEIGGLYCLLLPAFADIWWVEGPGLVVYRKTPGRN